VFLYCEVLLVVPVQPLVIVILLQAVTFYWATTNLISILQARLVRVGGVREMLGIPKMKKWDHDKLPIKEKGFKETIRESKSLN
jgi:membrane protein insertase Oxa1/YidC/SpoIIIJ